MADVGAPRSLANAGFVGAVWLVAAMAAACSSRGVDLQMLEKGTSGAAVRQRFGPPDRQVVAVQDDFHASVCPGAVTVLFYSDLHGPLGRVVHGWLDLGDAAVCVDRADRVVGVYSVEY